ncbi:uncharacterized protein LOC119085753 [Bradysia coprophila]|uniref:uncharacterized protein LOC119085753 n=1 Tax=Bradysia coprophila TaxID=38358 RepID=UPI00187DA20E|nr:uncharacterized protein LOC119085753 [Bradysia coprophila]
MELAASVRNLFKKRDLKDEIEKSLGEDRNFENVLTDVFVVYAKLGFFHLADWETTICKSIGNVNPLPQPDLHVTPSTNPSTEDGSQTDNVAQTDDGAQADNIAQTDDGVQADAVAPSVQRRRQRVKIASEVARRSERIRWQAERYTYN